MFTEGGPQEFTELFLSFLNKITSLQLLFKNITINFTVLESMGLDSLHRSYTLQIYLP